MKTLIKITDSTPFDFKELNKVYGEMFLKMGNLIYCEEKILYPLAVSIIPQNEFIKLLSDVEELGTAFNVNLSDFTGGKKMSENLNNNQKRKNELSRIISALNETDNKTAV